MRQFCIQLFGLTADVLFSRCLSRIRILGSFRIFRSRKIPKRPKIAYAVLAHERPEYLEVCLLTLFRSDLSKYEVDIFLMDDGSSDPKVSEILETYRSESRTIKYFSHSQTKSAGEVINRAIDFMKSFGLYDLYAWSDPDAIYSYNWLDNTIKLAINARNEGNLNRLGPFTSFNSNDAGHVIVKKSFFRSVNANIVVREVAGMVNMFATLSDLSIMGNFPENLSDEHEMCRRMRRRGLYYFSTYHSYIEHIGINSNFVAQRVNNNVQMVTGLNKILEEWPEEIEEYSAFRAYRDFIRLESDAGPNDPLQISNTLNSDNREVK